MGQFEDLKLFTTVVDQGSISRAAEVLNVAKSAVSRRLSLLEQRYGARLINRGSGKWEVTTTGRELYQRAFNVVSDADELENDFTEATHTLAGPLRISLPREFGLSFLSPSLRAFKERYPEIQLMVDFDDHLIDLSRDNYDFAIRITPDIGTGKVAEQIGSSEHKVFASPSYLARHGEPACLEDLKNHDLLQFGSARRSSWSFKDATGKSRSLEFQPYLNSNSGMFLLEATQAGLGISRLPDFIGQPSINEGAVVPILTDLIAPEFGTYLIQSEERRLNRRMRLFAEEMIAACGSDRHKFEPAGSIA
ncbi:MAG: LysR family transcriptional regulator [Rhizobiaceae bacterium]